MLLRLLHRLALLSLLATLIAAAVAERSATWCNAMQTLQARCCCPDAELSTPEQGPQLERSACCEARHRPDALASLEAQRKQPGPQLVLVVSLTVPEVGSVLSPQRLLPPHRGASRARAPGPPPHARNCIYLV